MEIHNPHKTTAEEMTKYHSDEYIKCLHSVRPDNMSDYSKQMQKFSIGDDCPEFDGLNFVNWCLYIIIDIHHGDGAQEAFYVMTIIP